MKTRMPGERTRTARTPTSCEDLLVGSMVSPLTQKGFESKVLGKSSDAHVSADLYVEGNWITILLKMFNSRMCSNHSY